MLTLSSSLPPSSLRLVLEGASLIAIHKARYYRRQDGLALGPGPFVAGLEYATERQAEVVGKPEQSFFLEALRELGCSPEDAIMIGDVSGLLTPGAPSEDPEKCALLPPFLGVTLCPIEVQSLHSWSLPVFLPL